LRQGANGFELREVPEQHGSHRVFLDPVDPGLRVDLGAVVAREEPIALQAPRGHEDEDAEGGVAEAEAPRFRLGVHPDHVVDPLDVAVDLLELLGPLRVVGQLAERLHRLEMEQAAELVVARHASLARSQDVGRGQVDLIAVRPLEVLQEPREVVQRDCARVRAPE
jgi:hypothetical protein